MQGEDLASLKQGAGLEKGLWNGYPSTTIEQTTTIADSPIRSGDQIFIPERGWLSRNSNVVAAALAGVISLSIAFIVR